ncbi:MAG TPA: hypothetical protein VGI81_02230 [Tepidisphaeraceae bacterium]|jgi:hypothetical protein
MDSYKLAVKFPFEGLSRVKAEDFTPVFHRWIQGKALPGHQLIDVAPYEHVKDGPGVVLVSHEANIHADETGGKPGLLYRRKHPFGESFRDRLKVTWGAALKAAALLEQEASLAGQAKIRTDEASFLIFDRLLAPNTPETFSAVRNELESFLKTLYGVPSVELTYQQKPEEGFEVGIKTGKSIPVATLLDRVATM